MCESIDPDSPALSQRPNLQLNPSFFTGSVMGRVKLDIKKLENSGARQATYSKRKHGILKKAQELSILCDIDLLLIMFSPGGKPSLCCGKNGIEDVIAKFNQSPPQERTKRKLEGLEALKKTFKKLDHDDLTDQAATLRTRLDDIHERLRCWRNPDRVSDMELLMQMEDSLEKSLNHIHTEKENFQKRQRVSLESNAKLPFHVSDEQQLQRLLWTMNGDIQQMVLTPEPKLPTQRSREMESCTGSNSESHFGCLSTSSKSETNSPTAPPQLSGTMDSISLGQAGQFGGQYQYLPVPLPLPLPYGLNMMQADTTTNTHANLQAGQNSSTVAYDVGRNYQPNLPVTWHDISNQLIPPPSPADSVFGDFFNFQKPMMTVPAPIVPSIYEKIARDPSHLLFDNTPNHYA